MTYKLFIDDERNPVTNDWVIVRNSTEAIHVVQTRGCPSEIAFDHDLGADDTSIVFINWFINQILDGWLEIPPDFKYNVHSQNPIGASNIESKMDQIICWSKVKG